MLAWSEGTDNGRQKTRNHGYDIIVGGELFTDYSDHPRKLVTLNPKLKSTGAGRYQLLSRWWDAYHQQLVKRLLSEKSGRCWHCSRLRSVALYLWLIIGDIRQAIDRCSNIWASLPGAGYGQFRHKADSLIAKFKEAGGTVREIDVWAGRSLPGITRSGLSASSSACHGLLIMPLITPLPTKPSANKMPVWSWRTRRCRPCRCVSVVFAARCKIHEVIDAKAENDALRDDVAAGRRRLHIKQSAVDQCAKPPPPPAWIVGLRLANAAERDYFTLEESWSSQKQQERNPEVC